MNSNCNISILSDLKEKSKRYFRLFKKSYEARGKRLQNRRICGMIKTRYFTKRAVGDEQSDQMRRRMLDGSKNSDRIWKYIDR